MPLPHPSHTHTTQPHTHTRTHLEEHSKGKLKKEWYDGIEYII